MDKKDIEMHLKTVQFLKTFDADVKSLVDKLIKRYNDFPKDNAGIVVNVMATICARIIAAVSPIGYWEHVVIGITKALSEEHYRRIKRRK